MSFYLIYRYLRFKMTTVIYFIQAFWKVPKCSSVHKTEDPRCLC